jgi:hypothetical protein
MEAFHLIDQTPKLSSQNQARFYPRQYQSITNAVLAKKNFSSNRVYTRERGSGFLIGNVSIDVRFGVHIGQIVAESRETSFQYKQKYSCKHDSFDVIAQLTRICHINVMKEILSNQMHFGHKDNLWMDVI